MLSLSGFSGSHSTGLQLSKHLQQMISRLSSHTASKEAVSVQTALPGTGPSPCSRSPTLCMKITTHCAQRLWGWVGSLGFLIFQKTFLRGGFLCSHWTIPILSHWTVLVVQTCCLWDLLHNSVWWFSFVSHCKVLQDNFKISPNTEPYCSYSSKKGRPGPWLWDSFT